MRNSMKIAEQTVVTTTTTTTTTRYVEDPERPAIGTAVTLPVKLTKLPERTGANIAEESPVPPTTALVIEFPPSDGPQEVVVLGETEPIAFADLKVVGGRIMFGLARGENEAGFPRQDILLAGDLDAFAVCGFANMLLQPVQIEFKSGHDSATVFGLEAIRSDQPVQRGNTVQARFIVRQTIAHASPIYVVLRADVIVDTVKDHAAQ